MNIITLTNAQNKTIWVNAGAIQMFLKEQTKGYDWTAIHLIREIVFVLNTPAEIVDKINGEV